MFIRTAVAAIACAACVANADTVDVKFIGTGKGSNATISLDNSNKSVFVGQLKHSFSNGTGAGADIQGDYVTFCCDLTQYVTSSPMTYSVETPDDMPHSPGYSAMGADAAQAIFDIYKFANGAQLTGASSNAFATAFQLAIWEIVYDFDSQEAGNGLNTGNGAFKVQSLAGGLATDINNHLTSLFAAIGNGGNGSGVYGVASYCAQDQLVVVPLPAPAMLGMAGLGGLAIVRRRMTRV